MWGVNYYDLLQSWKSKHSKQGVIDNKLKVYIGIINQGQIFGYQEETSCFKIYELSENKSLISIFLMVEILKEVDFVELLGEYQLSLVKVGKSMY